MSGSGRTFWMELKKHVFIYGLFLKNSLISQMEYKANFITGVLMEFGYLIAKILYVIVIYRSGKTINGLSPDAILLFIGAFVMMTGLYAGLFAANFFDLRGHIRNGTLDMVITKPVSLQFILTLRRSDAGILAFDVLGGLVMVAIGWSRTAVPFNLLNALGFLGFMVSGAVVGYALFLLPQIFSFWFVNTSSIAEVTDSFWDFNNVPMTVYNRFIQRVGVFAFPIFVVTNFPALFVLGKMNAVYAVWGITAPIVLLFVTRLFWNHAVRNYSSASS